MHFFRPGKFWTWGALALTVITLGLFFYTKRSPKAPARSEKVAATGHVLYADDYPVDENFREELHQLRMQARLTPQNEQVVLEGVRKTGEVMGVPPAVLWCLLFQESRLDPLAGHTEGGAVGLGQFSKFSFYEVNHHLTKFSNNNLTAFNQLLGQDVRPIAPKLSRDLDISSYYFVPTAVVASAAYLNNRYLHLRSLLDTHHLSYDEELLWMYATLAYNKGTRAVLSFWNTVQKTKGTEGLQRSLLSMEDLSKTVEDTRLIRTAFGRIWPKYQAASYAKEWSIHFRNTSRCAFRPERLPQKPMEREAD